MACCMCPLLRNKRQREAYEAVVLGQEHGDASVYLAYSQGDQHRDEERSSNPGIKTGA